MFTIRGRRDDNSPRKGRTRRRYERIIRGFVWELLLRELAALCQPRTYSARTDTQIFPDVYSEKGALAMLVC